MNTRLKGYLISGGAIVVLAFGVALAGLDVQIAAIGLMAIGVGLFVVGTFGYVIERNQTVRQRRSGKSASGGATVWSGLAGHPSYITEDGSGTPSP